MPATLRDHPGLVWAALAAASAAVGLLTHPLAAVPALLSAAALTLLGARRAGAVVLCVLILAALGGLRVDASHRTAAAVQPAPR